MGEGKGRLIPSPGARAKIKRIGPGTERAVAFGANRIGETKFCGLPPSREGLVPHPPTIGR